MRIGSLFSGYGGLEMGVEAVLGGTAAWHSEIDPGACKILAHRYPGVPNLGDITAVDWSQVEPVDVLTGGFPCQDVSAAGKRLGIRPGTRSGLWAQFAYAIDQLRPGLVLIENVRGLLSAAAESDLEPCPWCVGDDGGVPLRACGAVLGDLAGLGYDASWHGLRAADVGAPHARFRVFILAWPAADPERRRRDGRPGTPGPGRWAQFEDGRGTAPNTDCGERAGWQCDEERGPIGRVPTAGAGGGDSDRGADWGPYETAVRQWERLTRPAPAPTAPGRSGPRLAPAFVEWMMGLPSGWVTDVPGLSRNDQLKALGNGVVPQQAAAALRILLADHPKETAA